MKKGKALIIIGIVLLVIQLVSCVGNQASELSELRSFIISLQPLPYRIGHFMGNNIAGIIGAVLIIIGLVLKNRANNDTAQVSETSSSINKAEQKLSSDDNFEKQADEAELEKTSTAKKQSTNKKILIVGIAAFFAILATILILYVAGNANVTELDSNASGDSGRVESQNSGDRENTIFDSMPSIGDLAYFGGYEWRVLDVKDAKVLIITENVVEQREYHHTLGDITWADSSIREYLNNEFYELFDESDRARISDTVLLNDDNPWYGTNGGGNTTDKVFLMSLEEVAKYFGDSGQLANQDHPKNHRLNGVFDQYDGSRIALDSNGSASWWWLRSPGSESVFAAIIPDDGSIYTYGRPIHNDGGVRPAIWLNLEG